MNRLSIRKRSEILRGIVQGNSLRATTCSADVSINTVSKLLVDLGTACAEYHDTHVRDVRAQRIQCEEIWSFVGAKAKNVAPEKQTHSWGDTWTWIAIDADSKLCLSCRIGGRDGAIAFEFMQDLASRLANCVQLAIDGHRVYLNTVEGVFGSTIDYAMLVKIYGNDSANDPRYSPPESVDSRNFLTNFAQRQNLNMRMGIRRFTHLTNGCSKKIRNHTAMVAIHFMHHNFAWVQKTSGITPAMAAGLTDHVWSLEEIVLLSN